jgi:hypothetical protein
MMRRIAIAALLLAAVIAPAAALCADDALPEQCAADAKQFCPDLGQSDPKLRGCLKQHDADLSRNCTYALKGKLPPHRASKLDKPKSGKLEDCKTEIDKYCPGKEGKEARICLSAHKDALSSSCATAVDEIDAKRQLKKDDDKAITACKADRKKLCADKKGEDAKACLKEHEADLSAACRDAVSAAGK